MALKPSPLFFEIENDDTLFKIPLRNITKEIIAYTLVDEHRYDEINKHRWYLDRKYARCAFQNKSIFMHHMVHGPPPENLYIDHKNGNKLDNRESNLHPVTYSQNSQNRSRSNNKEYASKYIGLSKESGKWRVQVRYNYEYINLGSFESEVEAAKQYDIYVLLKIGQYAKTNGLISYEEAVNLNINPDDLVKSRKGKELPKGISYNKKKNRYKVSVVYQGELYEDHFKNLEPAMLQLEEYLNHIEDLKAKEKEEHYSQDIERDQNGNAILLIKNGEVSDEVIVDDDKWHELSSYSWSMSSDREYYKAIINGKFTCLHRYVLLGEEAFLKKGRVDHADRNKKNNKVSNLRLVSAKLNAHNVSKRKSTSSKYIGVCFDKRTNAYKGYIKCDAVTHHCGYHKTEKEAARARNAKAIELHGDLANLNDISDDEDEEEEILTNQLNEININE